ncbi:MAG: hypothetical protein GEU99_15980 [Luteitalea sp.]|nr:hypothetical protein [Luteitalea sp.]
MRRVIHPRIAYRSSLVIAATLAVLVSDAWPQQTAAEQEPPATSTAAPAPPSDASIAKAKEVLAELTSAVGGREAAELRSLVFEADMRRVFGERELTGTFTMRFLFPDKFQRVDEFQRPDGMPGGTVTTTVDGEESWTEAEGGRFGGGRFRGGPGPGEPGGPRGAQQSDGPRGGRANMARAEFYRALLGVLPSSAERSGLTFAHAGEAQAENGQIADVLDVTADRFAARLFVDRETRLPLMMTYQAPNFLGGMRVRRPPPQGASDEEQRKAREEMRREMRAQGPPPMVESQLFFSEYAREDGLQMPHKITRQVDGQVQEEWTITKVEVNPDLEPGQFQKKG